MSQLLSQHWPPQSTTKNKKAKGKIFPLIKTTLVREGHVSAFCERMLASRALSSCPDVQTKPTVQDECGFLKMGPQGLYVYIYLMIIGGSWGCQGL